VIRILSIALILAATAAAAPVSAETYRL